MSKNSSVAAETLRARGSVNRTELLLSLALGAVVSAILLTALGFRAREIWSPFGQKEVGSNVFRGLIFSGLIGGLVATVAMRGLDRVSLRILPGAACALGWGILGGLFHTDSSTRFASFQVANAQSENTLRAVFWSNGISQPLCVAFSLVVAAIVGWLAEKRFFGPQRLAQKTGKNKKSLQVEAEAPALDFADAPRAFSRNLSFPFFAAVPGFALLAIFGLVMFALPLPAASELPAAPFRAALSALISMAAFGGGAFLARRYFSDAAARNGQENTVAYLIAAPIVIAFVCGMMYQSGGVAPIFESAARVIWNSSPFEAASWGAFGSALGFWLAGRKKD